MLHVVLSTCLQIPVHTSGVCIPQACPALKHHAVEGGGGVGVGWGWKSSESLSVLLSYFPFPPF